MVITYCEQCGELIRADLHHDNPDLCSACASGAKLPAIRSRDSGHIPYAQRPSASDILREIKQRVRR